MTQSTFIYVDVETWQAIGAFCSSFAAIAAAIALFQNARATRHQAAAQDFATANQIRDEFDKYITQLTKTQGSMRTLAHRAYLNHLEQLAGFYLAGRLQPITSKFAREHLIDAIGVMLTAHDSASLLQKIPDRPDVYEHIHEFRAKWGPTMMKRHGVS